MSGGEQEWTFWIERLARLTKANRFVASVLGDESYGPYVLVLAATLVERPLPTAFDYLQGKSALVPYLWWEWPGVLWWLVPVMLVLSVVFMRTLRKRYHRAIHKAGESRNEIPIVESGLPRGLQSGTLVLGLTVYVILFSTAFDQLFATNPIYATVRWIVIIPFIYVPIATDIVAAYFHVEIVLPLRIRSGGVKLDFSDIRRLGGMYPVGQVMQFAALAVFTALALYTIYWFLGFTILSTLTPPVDRKLVLLGFMIGWPFSVIIPATGLYLIHQYMYSSREAQINRILSRTRDLGDDEDVFPYTAPNSDRERQIYIEEYIRLDLVERTRTVPFNVVVVWELIIGALVPVVLQILTFVLEPL